jgi:2-succinyl-6-hydroxy-2,4-cyclohexadiene-1-carboxylate synthase
MKTIMYALHGFLGLPSDWDNIKTMLGVSLQTPDLFAISDSSNGLECWGQAFNKYVAKEPAQKRILLGYSLGGRLSLHALLDEPELWTGAIIISANTGISYNDEKAARLKNDTHWSQRFLNDEWEALIKDWNSQNAFSGQAPAFTRKEANYQRAHLAKALVHWSLAQQNDLQNSLLKLSMPILWIAGEKDIKFVEIAQRISAEHSQFSCWIAPGAGHRVPWEASQLFVEKIKLWLTNFAIQ